MTKTTDSEIAKVLGSDNQGAIRVMEKVFEDHKSQASVVLNPDSWTGKELLRMGRRLIDIDYKLAALESSMNRLHMKVDRLSSDAQE